jgi:ribosomal protein L37E
MSDNAMPLSLLVKTHEKCQRCGVMFPQKFLSCPACAGFQKKREQWAVPGKPKAEETSQCKSHRFSTSCRSTRDELRRLA